MEDKFLDVLSTVNAKPGRSRLEPYGELVDELRQKGLTCRDIAAVLAEKLPVSDLEKCGQQFCASAKAEEPQSLAPRGDAAP